MKTDRVANYTTRKPNPEAGLTAEEKRIRRELLTATAPVTHAAVLIAGLRAQLAALEPKP